MYVLCLFPPPATWRFESHELIPDSGIGVLVLQCLFGLFKVFKMGVEIDRAEQEENDKTVNRDLAMNLPL